MGRPRVLLGVLGIATSLAVACGGADDTPCNETGSCGPAPLVTPDVKDELARVDTTVFQVTWKPTTHVLDEARVRATLETPFVEDGEPLRFAASADDVRALPVGDVAFLPGVGVLRVRSVVEEGGAILLSADPAALEEAVDDAVIMWDQAAPSMDELVDLTDAAANGGQAGLGTQSIGGGVDRLTDNYRLRFDVKRSADPAALDFSMSAKSAVTNEPVSALAWGTSVRFRTQGSIVIEKGVFRYARLDVRNIAADVHVDVGIARLGTGGVLPPVSRFPLPSMLSVPFTVGGLPLYATLAGAVEIETTAVKDTAILASLKVRARGQAGFTVFRDSPTQYRGRSRSSTRNWRRASTRRCSPSASECGSIFRRFRSASGCPFSISYRRACSRG